MQRQSDHDAWQAAESYERYMGRWSRAIAPPFLQWLAAPPDSDWLEIGCGTGALSAAIIAAADPRSLLAIEPSEGFRARANATVDDRRASFVPGDACDLSIASASRDVVVSGLVLNFVADRGRALAEMRRALRPGGRLGFYVWDYPGSGMQLIAEFWAAAAALDPAAAEFDEARRFPFCTPDALRAMTADAGFEDPEAAAIAQPIRLPDFEDFWRPFTLGTGPAPGYCASLDPEAREALRARLAAQLPRAADGTISLSARAWAVKARA